MFKPKNTQEIIVPVRLDKDSTFSFTCDKDLACFTRCCKEANTMLTPYDIIRLKKRLGLTSDEFLYLFTYPGLIEGTELPVPVLKPLENQEKGCPFLSDDGCTVYEDRPLACRYYPIGSGIFHNRDESQDERFFALIKEPHCLGHGLGGEITVGEWMESQGINEYEEPNAGWVDIILKRKSMGPFLTVQDKTLQMFFMASYNIDAFRRFVFDSKFLDIYKILGETVEKIKDDDLELLNFAMKWLKGTFFGEGKFEVSTQTTDAETVGA